MATINTNTWSAGDTLSASDMNTYVRDNMLGLLEPAREILNPTTGTDYTTTSASFVDVNTTDFQVDLTPNIENGLTCDILIGGTISLRCSGTATAQVTNFDLMVNGTSVSGGTGIAVFEGTSSQIYTFTLNYILSGQDNSAKSIKLRWRTNGGTARIFMVSGSPREAKNQFWARVL